MKKMKLVALLAWAPIGMIYSGVVLTKLWGWFLVPYGLKPISLIIAIGISLILSQIKGYTKKEDKDISALDVILGSIIHNSTLFIVGFVLSLIM